MGIFRGVGGTGESSSDSTINATTGIVFEGATADAHETTLTVTDPTADRTITLPNATGTVTLDGVASTLTSKTITSGTLGSDLAAGFDLASAHDITIRAGGRAMVKTDIAVACPPGTYARIAPRSGLAFKFGIDVGAGVIDADIEVAIGGDDDAVELFDAAGAQCQSEGIAIFDGGTDGGGEADVYAGAGGGGHQAIDNRCGVIGDWEHASIFLGLRGHATPSEPFDGVARLETMKCSEKLTAAAGVFLHQFSWFEAGMGHVTTPAAGDADFRQEMRGRFEEGD